MKRIAILLFLSAIHFELNATVVSGSGCVLDTRHVLTAAHVVQGSKAIKVRIGNEDVHAEIERQNLLDDWAILKIEKDARNFVSISDAQPSLGEKIYVLGFPSSSLLGENVKYSEGTISSQTGLRGAAECFQFTAPIQPGNSGGPIFNSEGCLVGIVLSTLDPGKFSKVTGGSLPQNINFGLHLSHIMDNIVEIGVRKQKGAAKRAVKDNQYATCFITAVISEIPKANSLRIAKIPEVNSGNDADLHWTQKYSPRFSAIIGFMRNLSARRFILPDGKVVAPKSTNDFDRIFTAFRRAEMLVKNELRFNIGSEMKWWRRYPEYESVNDLCAKAYNMIVDEYEEKLGKKDTLIGETFFGAHLGSVSSTDTKNSNSVWFPQFTHIIDNEVYPSHSGCSMSHFQHVKSYWTTIPNKKKFYGNDRLHLFLTEAWKLVGIEYWPKYQMKEDVEEAVEDVKLIFERKYGIRFRRVPVGFKPDVKSIHAAISSGFPDVNAYIFNDGLLTIYIYAWSCEMDRSRPCPWVTISFTDFYKAVNDDYEKNFKAKSDKVNQSDLDAL